MSRKQKEPHREGVAGRRLAAIIATAAARMSPAERTLLWLECRLLFGPTIDKEMRPELYAIIRSLRYAVPNDMLASKWN